MKFARYSLGLVLFVGAFLGSVKLFDSCHERWLKDQIKLVRSGMAKDEVIDILGQPTSRHMTDGPGSYWCYGSDSFNDSEEYCGKVSLLMGDERVVSVSPVLP